MSRRRRYSRDDYYRRDSYWPPYVPVAERRAQAQRQIEKLTPKGESLSPVKLEGRTIAATFWGKAWCENLERYSDYSNRLPRGRSYVRNGSVLDLKILPGLVRARVAGSSLYEVVVEIKPVPAPRWKEICRDCAGGIDSLVELLQGRFSRGVMERICRPGEGLFPAPAEIKLGCSCPDWATMCKLVAAVLYGVGARLDHSPELLFRLRQVDEKDLLSRAGTGLPLTRREVAPDKLLAESDLSDIFGLEMAAETSLAPVEAPGKKHGRPKKSATPSPAVPAPRKRGRPRKQPATPLPDPESGAGGKRRGRPKKLPAVPPAGKKAEKAPAKTRQKTGRRSAPRCR